MKTNLLTSKVFLLLALITTISIQSSAQCTWKNFLIDGYEYTTTIPGLVAGTTTHNTPQNFATHNGTKSMYMNFTTGLAGGSLVYERVINVCPNVPHQISTWLTTSFSGVQCNVRIEVVDANDTVLAFIDSLAAGYAPSWSNYGTGSITPTTSTIKFRLYTNTPGSQGGNDLSMDDFVVEQCSPLNLGPNVTICNTLTDTLDAGPGFTTYSWSNGATSQYIVASTTFSGNTFSTYHVSVTDSGGCTFKDTIVVTFTVCASVNGIDNNSGIAVYPNPANGLVTIYADKTISKITMYNALGAKAAEYIDVDKINVSEFTRGVYILKIETSDGNKRFKKIILE